MLLSKSCIYGLRASIYIASTRDEQFMSIREIADKLDISFHFLTKILQALTQEGIMNSYRGPKGGIMLAKNANTISIFDIVKAIDGNEVFTECFLGLPHCGSATPCPLHEQWAGIRANIAKVLATTTLADLAAKVSTLHYRLTENDIIALTKKV